MNSTPFVEKKRPKQTVLKNLILEAYASVVSTILANIDGIKPLNNILVIGITNRKDLIEKAMIRHGRIEVHIEVSLPDEQGRMEILKIHA